MSHDADRTYLELLTLAKTEADVLGFVLCGSRGKGAATGHSDYDCAMIVEDGTSELYSGRMVEFPPLLDVKVYTLQQFAEHAAWGGPMVWDRYNWTHIRAQVDKTEGKIQQMIDEKGKVPAGEVGGFIRGELDHYINQVYRSIKCLRDENILGYRFEAADSIRPLLDVLFAVHHGRLRPYYKYLQWELNEFPLSKLPWRANELLEMMQAVLADGACRMQQRLFKGVEQVLREDGFGEVFDSWGDRLWIKDFRPPGVGKEDTGGRGSDHPGFR